MGRPYFTIISCKSVIINGEDLCEVVFNATHAVDPKSRDPQDQIQGGTLLFDPGHLWCLCGYNLEMDNSAGKGKITCTIHNTINDALAIPVFDSSTAVSEWSFKSGGGSKMSATDRFSLNVPEVSPRNEEITLSAFGLPEPPGVDWKKPTPWNILFILAGILCLIAGPGFRILKRRLSPNLSLPETKG